MKARAAPAARAALTTTVATAMALATAACFPSGPALVGQADPLGCDETFNDHTHKGPIDVDAFVALSRDPVDARTQAVDFIITTPRGPAVRAARFADAHFYGYHDEWYWFRLLNGQSACGASTTPVDLGRSFSTVQEIYDAFAGVDDSALPLDLARVGGVRLVSPSFYALALRTQPRAYVTGTVLRFVGDGGDDAWAFELADVDEVGRDDLGLVFDILDDALPPGAEVAWRLTGGAHEALAATLADDGDPLAARVLARGATPGAPGCCAAVDVAGTGLVALLAVAGRRSGRARRSKA